MRAANAGDYRTARPSALYFSTKPKGYGRFHRKTRLTGVSTGEVSLLVAVVFGGLLKAEHGTGHNVAPFVALEWGA